MMKKADIIETCKGQIFIVNITEIAHTKPYICIETLFQHSDHSYIDIFYDPETNFLTDLSMLTFIFYFSNKMYKFLETYEIKELLERYQVTVKNLQFFRNISSNLNEDIFKFGEFCSIISNLMLKANLHIPENES